MKKKITIACIGGAIVLVLFLFFFIKDSGKSDVIEEDHSRSDTFLENCVVEVKGEVNRPGLYIVSSEARIGDVIELAMGFTENADTSNINLALKVEDGMQIIVYTYYVDTGEVKNLVNINTAAVDELMKLPGIGEVKAKAIVEYRKKNGWFNDISELKNVSGISESLFEQIKELITV